MRRESGALEKPATNGEDSMGAMGQISSGAACGAGQVSWAGWEFEVEPWPERVNGKELLDELAGAFGRYVVLPKWGREALALWTVHTYAFELREVTAYLGIESPQKRCGKSTLLAVLSCVVNRPVVASNISPSAFFRVIEEMRPTLLIDEADTFLRGNEELRGILNSGYTRSTAFVVRVDNSGGGSAEGESGAGGEVVSEAKAKAAAGERSARGRSVRLPNLSRGLALFSSWCPKAIAAIGRLPDTLADRCLLIRMHRKTAQEQCDRLRNLRRWAPVLRRKCARFVRDHATAIGEACPGLPSALNDRAADIWEPLFAVADLAGGDWPELARQSALGLAQHTQEPTAMGSLFVDILLVFTVEQSETLFTRTLVAGLNNFSNHTWAESRKGKPITDLWLAQQLRPYSIRPRTVRIGEMTGKGYVLEDFRESFKRYIQRSEFEALVRETMVPGPKVDVGSGS